MVTKICIALKLYWSSTQSKGYYRLQCISSNLDIFWWKVSEWFKARLAVRWRGTRGLMVKTYRGISWQLFVCNYYIWNLDKIMLLYSGLDLISEVKMKFVGTFLACVSYLTWNWVKNHWISWGCLQMVAYLAVTPADLGMEGASWSAGDMATLMSPTVVLERSLSLQPLGILKWK